VAAFDEKNYHIVPSTVLRQSIRRTIFATDVESTRYALGGVLLELEPATMSMVATDSRRLALVKSVCRSQGMDEAGSLSPVVPAKAMSLIEKSISDEDEEVLVAVHANDVLVKTGRSTIYSRLVEGRFPRYRDVIPQEANATLDLVVGPFPFYSAVRQAQIVTNEESRGVDFQFKDGTLTLSSQAAEIGQSKIELPIAYDGAELTITFDPRFVADFLKVLEPESQVELRLIDSESAAVLRSGEDYTYVIMPLSRER
jgi:DNA polymerase-3 subunit beta